MSPLLSIKQDLQDLLLHQHMEVRIVPALQLRMQVSMSGVLPPSIEPDITIITLNGIILIEILQIVRLRVSQLGRCFDEGVFGAAARVSAFGDVDRTVEAMAVFVPLPVVCLELRTNLISNRDICTTITAKVPFSRKESSHPLTTLPSSTNQSRSVDREYRPSNSWPSHRPGCRPRGQLATDPPAGATFESARRA